MRAFVKKLIPKGIRQIYIGLRKHMITAEFHLFRIFPIQKKRVVLCNVWGFGDNTKWIAKALRRADKSTEVIFVTDRSATEHVPKGIRVVQNNTPRAVYYLATAHVWVDCNRKESYIVKRSGQIYIQTWHGSLPLKKLEADHTGLSEEYMQNALRDSRMTDLCLSNGEFMNDIYRKAFGYECEIQITGSARLDPLIRPNVKRVVRTKKMIASLVKPDGKSWSVQDEKGQTEQDEESRSSQDGSYEGIKIAVYAPTYRENGGSPALPDFEIVRKKLEERFGGEFIIVVRVHPLVRSKLKNCGSRVVDGSFFGDLYELLEASDVLITDYSNTMFEFAYAQRPVFLYADDVEAYEAERGFYFDYGALPFPHSSTTDELCSEIEDYSAFDYKNEQRTFFENIGIREDGKASRRIAELILRKVYRS
ncbi:MAG: CDP-glycerol glycerophosphotransferase family protein [Lachnospiraceae bacterium]|nr:CDP-glycerol glycerophosphotransferase family protein [Lachnospiraceae bacterium]